MTPKARGRSHSPTRARRRNTATTRTSPCSSAETTTRPWTAASTSCCRAAVCGQTIPSSASTSTETSRATASSTPSAGLVPAPGWHPRRAALYELHPVVRQRHRLHLVLDQHARGGRAPGPARQPVPQESAGLSQLSFPGRPHPDYGRVRHQGEKRQEGWWRRSRVIFWMPCGGGGLWRSSC